MNTCGISVQKLLRQLNSWNLEEVAAREDEFGKLAKAEVARRKRKRERKAQKAA